MSLKILISDWYRIIQNTSISHNYCKAMYKKPLQKFWIPKDRGLILDYTSTLFQDSFILTLDRFDCGFKFLLGNFAFNCMCEISALHSEFFLSLFIVYKELQLLKCYFVDFSLIYRDFILHQYIETPFHSKDDGVCTIVIN